MTSGYVPRSIDPGPRSSPGGPKKNFSRTLGPGQEREDVGERGRARAQGIDLRDLL
jgi:hypothetical protein